jgi:predicted membrane protein
MKKLIGLIIILLGIGFLLEQLNIGWAGNFINIWWPVVVIAVGLHAWQKNRHAWFGPMIITLVGIILLLDQLKVFEKSAWEYFWPVIIILIGGRVLFGRKQGDHVKAERGDANASAVFSGVERVVTGRFTGGDVTAWFGGVKLDLRNAQFEGDATLNVFAAFGGVDVLLPKNVRVVTNVSPLFGGAEDKTQPEQNATKTLTITGTALFGGVGVKN